jgi:hypothetical protein
VFQEVRVVEASVVGAVVYIGEEPAQQLRSGVVFTVEAPVQIDDLELEHDVVDEVCQVRAGG